MENSFVKNTDFSGKKVAVVGFGIEGKSVCRFFQGRGAEVSVFDERALSEFDGKVVDEFEKKGIVFHFGDISTLTSFDVVVRSPGVYFEKPYLTEARAKGVVVTSATKIFFDLCPCKIVGVSGTKGKGTTSTLIFEMLEKSGLNAHLAGNIGTPMLDLLSQLTPESVVVLELSSFQLQDLDKSPHVAVLLMVVPEHMDYHKDFSEYLEAKRNIVRFQKESDFAIFNHDYPASNESDVFTSAKVFYVSREGSVNEGCFVEDGRVVFRGPVGDDKTGPAALHPHSTSSSSAAGDQWGTPASRHPSSSSTSKDVDVIETKDIKLAGRHNLENVCAAVVVAKILGVRDGVVVDILRNFSGLEHRLELVREVEGVTFYNDSFSTIPETTIAAIEAFDYPKVLILGGSGKNSDFEELGKVVSNSNIRAIIGVGEEWSRIKMSIQRFVQGVECIEGKKTMKEIVGAACKVSQDGDVVLLSPACASFGMFENYKVRGEKFKEEVMKL